MKQVNSCRKRSISQNREARDLTAERKHLGEKKIPLAEYWG